MRVLLRSTDTGLFYAGPDKWTSNQSEALDFQGADVAVDAAFQSKLPGVEVLMRFEDPLFEIPLTVVGLPQA